MGADTAPIFSFVVYYFKFLFGGLFCEGFYILMSNHSPYPGYLEASFGSLHETKVVQNPKFGMLVKLGLISIADSTNI